MSLKEDRRCGLRGKAVAERGRMSESEMGR